ncbi:hypothetical protein Tco_0293605, partial [Tanacetum coccineum]
MDLFNLISAPNPAVIKTGTRPRAAHEGDGEEDQGPETMASVVPPVGPLLTTGAAPNIVEEEGTAADAPFVSKRRRKRANEESGGNLLRL